MYIRRENSQINVPPLKKKTDTHTLILEILHYTKSESRAAKSTWKKELSKTRPLWW